MTNTLNPKQYEEEMLRLFKQNTEKKGAGNFLGIPCPSSYGEPCRLDDLCKEVLWDKTIDKEDPLKKKASSLNRKDKYWSNAIFATDPNKVVVIEYGIKIWQQLLAGQMDELSQWKYFFDPNKGRWLRLVKTQGKSKEQVEYKVEPNFQVSALPNMEILKKMYPLDNILALKANGLQTVYQSSIPTTCEFRILPSWLGPGIVKFFYGLKFHYGISKEDFEATLAGKMNPIRGTSSHNIPDYTTTSIATSSTQAPTGWGDPVATEPGEQGRFETEDDPLTPAPSTEPEICLGLFDANSPKCVGSCQQSEQCEKMHTERLNKRAAAKRLAPK